MPSEGGMIVGLVVLSSDSVDEGNEVDALFRHAVKVSRVNDKLSREESDWLFSPTAGAAEVIATIFETGLESGCFSR